MQQIDTRGVGEVHVEQHEVGREVDEGSARFAAGVGGADLPVIGEERFETRDYGLIVVDDENALGGVGHVRKSYGCANPKHKLCPQAIVNH